MRSTASLRAAAKQSFFHNEVVAKVAFENIGQMWTFATISKYRDCFATARNDGKNGIS